MLKHRVKDVLFTHAFVIVFVWQLLFVREVCAGRRWNW